MNSEHTEPGGSSSHPLLFSKSRVHTCQKFIFFWVMNGLGSIYLISCSCCASGIKAERAHWYIPSTTIYLACTRILAYFLLQPFPTCLPLLLLLCLLLPSRPLSRSFARTSVLLCLIVWLSSTSIWCVFLVSSLPFVVVLTSFLQKYLEAHKDELIKDKEFKEIIFKARSTVKKKFHTNTLKQPIHKVLKTITGWVQSEQHIVKSGPPASAPTGPRRDVFLFLFLFLLHTHLVSSRLRLLAAKAKPALSRGPLPL